MNTTTLVGRLTAAPELRHTPNGTAVTDLRLAVDRRTDGTDFLTVTAWNRTAEVAAEHLATGRRIAVSGRLEQQTWTDRESGANREKVVVVADRIEFLDAPRRDRSDDDAVGDGSAPDREPEPAA